MIGGQLFLEIKTFEELETLREALRMYADDREAHTCGDKDEYYTPAAKRAKALLSRACKIGE